MKVYILVARWLGGSSVGFRVYRTMKVYILVARWLGSSSVDFSLLVNEACEADVRGARKHARHSEILKRGGGEEGSGLEKNWNFNKSEVLLVRTRFYKLFIQLSCVHEQLNAHILAH